MGKPILQRQLEKLAVSLCVEKNIVFHGMLQRNKLIDLLKSCHVKMMLSKESSLGDVEGFGIAVLEANAVGLPAIGSKNTGIEDAIKDGFSGRLVTANNENEIVNALIDITENYADYSLHAKEYAAQHDWKHIVKVYTKFFDELY